MVRLPLLAAVTALAVCAAEPFSLRLADLSDAWFPGGATIHVPPDRCQQIQVRLNQPWAKNVRIADLTLALDGIYPRFERLASGAGYVLDARTREPRGHFVSPEHRIRVAVNDSDLPAAEWSILRWDQAYVRASVVGPSGQPIRIQLEQPTGGVALAGSGNTIRIRGQVVGAVSATLTAGTEEIRRIASRPGFYFDQQLAVPPEAKELTLTARDGPDSVEMIVIKILRH